MTENQKGVQSNFGTNPICSLLGRQAGKILDNTGLRKFAEWYKEFYL